MFRSIAKLSTPIRAISSGRYWTPSPPSLASMTISLKDELAVNKKKDTGKTSFDAVSLTQGLTKTPLALLEEGVDTCWSAT